jgi:hypothetical protein
MRIKLAFVVALFSLLFSGSAFAQYNPAAGINAPKVEKERRVRDKSGVERTEVYYESAPADRWGNAQGNANDLAIDGAFEGQTVAVIQLYQFDFELARAALKEKGFSVYRWNGRAPSPDELEKALAKSSQLWIIADSQRHLNDEHLRVIKKFYDEGHGLYIWGDNQPYYADANFVSQALFGTQMLGDLRGDHTVTLWKSPATTDAGGLKPNHLLTTGLEHIYEGITIATIQPNAMLEPLIYGSAGNLVASYYDKNGRRAILDGGFTRLYNKWDTAGTARYVKNAASWLVNAERFGDAVINPAIAKKPATPTTPLAIATEPVVTMTKAPAPARPWIATGLIALILASTMLVLLVAMNVPVNRRG